jgi:hypothetical protein
MPAMTDSWVSVPVEEVKVGDRLRLGSGQVIEVSKIEENFMGVDSMLAFIEDTSSQWYKQPMPKGASVEVERARS